MSYDFSFEKKSIILIAIGCVAIGVLLFFAGYIVGLDRGQNQSVVQASSAAAVKSSSSKETAAAEKEKPAAEKEPAAPAEEPKKAAPEKSPEPAAANAEGKSAAAPTDAKPAAGKEEDAKDKDKEKPAFSVQLGAFQTEENAVKLRDNLKTKGYSVFLFRVMDADGNVWNTVRTGHYADMKEAAREAVKITRKEQISAWVRPANAF